MELVIRIVALVDAEDAEDAGSEAVNEVEDA